ncbi:MAG: tetratricopeptide repeat protein [Magnetospirillum sp. WYHS-4]
MAWEAAENRFPHVVQCRAQLAECLIAADRPAEAEAVYRQAMADFRENVVCRAGLAKVYLMQDRHAEAEAAYREALALDAGNKVTMTGLADVLWKLGKDEEAAALTRQVMERWPDDPYTRSLAARLADHDAGGHVTAVPSPQTAGPQRKGGTRPSRRPWGAEIAEIAEAAKAAEARFLARLDAENGDAPWYVLLRDRFRNQGTASLGEAVESRQNDVYARLTLALHQPEEKARLAAEAAAFPGAWSVQAMATLAAGGAANWNALDRRFPTHAGATALAGLLAAADAQARRQFWGRQEDWTRAAPERDALAKALRDGLFQGLGDGPAAPTGDNLMAGKLKAAMRARIDDDFIRDRLEAKRADLEKLLESHLLADAAGALAA